MTLDTHVAITGPVSARAVYDFLAPLVGTPTSIKPKIEPGGIWNPPGIGADTWLGVNHGPDDGAQVMPRSPDCDSDDGDDREYYGNSPRHNGTAYVHVSMDTAYSYREGAETCSDLHARLVTALGRWLDAHEVPWTWRNEFTGEWFDRYDGLAAFGNAFASTGAEAWFAQTVLPAISALSSGGAQ